LGFDKFRANISNRKFLNGLITYAGASQEQFIPICLTIDKLPKIGRNLVMKELTDVKKISLESANKILDVISSKGESMDLIRRFQTDMQNIPQALDGLKELEIILKYLENSKVDSKYFQFAPFIARGLAYYTGPIWEFEIIDGDIGSVAGCGRYDNTIGRFLNTKIPATGGSFGIERIVEVIKARQMLKINPTTIQVLVTIFSPDSFNNALNTANSLREAGINTMLFSDPVKLDKQLKYADRKGIPYVIIQGPEEISKNVLKLKNMKTMTQEELSLENVIRKLKN